MEGRLEDLNSIVLPEPVGWLPLAPGWKVLLVLAALALALFAWRRWLAWRAERYRREALQELATMDSLEALPALLKRAALSAFPRAQIAALHGADWHRFLDESAEMTTFQAGCGAWLDRLAYGGASLEPTQADTLRAAAVDWLRQHRRND